MGVLVLTATAEAEQIWSFATPASAPASCSRHPSFGSLITRVVAETAQHAGRAEILREGVRRAHPEGRRRVPDSRLTAGVISAARSATGNAACDQRRLACSRHAPAYRAPHRTLDELVRFYRDGLGLELVGTFTGHDGYSGSTEKRRVVAELYLYLAAALTVLRRLINEARTRYRWPPRPTTRRLK